MGQVEDLQNKKYPKTWKMIIAEIIIVIVAFALLVIPFINLIK